MAYCRSCGAYIPDGQTKCLACGKEQTENSTSEYSSGYARENDPREASRQSNEEMRRRLDEQRRKQQEDNKRWAEAERQRRQQQQQTSYSDYTEETRRESEPFRPKNAQPNKLLAALSYLSVLFVLPYIFCRDDKFARYHAKQGAILFFITALGEAIGSAFGLGWIVTLMHLYWIYKGMTAANNGRMEPLPYIGNILSKEE